MKRHDQRFDPQGRRRPPRREDGAPGGATRGFAEVEYLVLVICVGIVTAIALYKLGPAILKNYRTQETTILQQGP